MYLLVEQLVLLRRWSGFSERKSQEPIKSFKCHQCLLLTRQPISCLHIYSLWFEEGVFNQPSWTAPSAWRPPSSSPPFASWAALAKHGASRTRTGQTGRGQLLPGSRDQQQELGLRREARVFSRTLSERGLIFSRLAALEEAEGWTLALLGRKLERKRNECFFFSLKLGESKHSSREHCCKAWKSEASSVL